MPYKIKDWKSHAPVEAKPGADESFKSGNWQECNLVNDTNAARPRCSWVLLERSMTQMQFGQWHECSETKVLMGPFRAVNDTNAVWSMTRMQITECKSHSVCAFVSLTTSQWHECRHQTFLHPLIERSMTRMQFGQWHRCRLLSVNHTHCIRVIDHWSMTRMQLLSYSKNAFFPL